MTMEPLSGRAVGLCAAAVLGLALSSVAPAAQSVQSASAVPYPAEQIAAGSTLFASTCGFCHGREATGGPTGPDLTESALVASDVRGDKIGPLVRAGRPERGMPALTLSDSDMAAVVAYLHSQKARLDAQPGRRRRISNEDLLSGGANAEAGRQYFNGAGGCTKCHSTTGDLAGVANRFGGLALLQQLLYPRRTIAPGTRGTGLPVQARVTLPDGVVVTGGVVARDEFTIAILDADGWYRSWPLSQVKVAVTDPLRAHADLLGKYTDADMHNLYAYLATLR